MNQATIEALCHFARRVIIAALEGTLESEETETWASELGFLYKDVATEHDCTLGFPGEPGDLVYRVPEWVTEEL